MTPILEARNLTVKRGEKIVLSDISFSLNRGEVLLLTGGNGAGKSTLAGALMGFADCVVENGSIKLDGQDISSVPTFERARRGIFLAHQELPAIPGVSAVDVLRASAEATDPEGFSLSDFYARLRAALEDLGLTLDFAKKELHVAFSGGEKKRIELLSLLMSRPKVGILDELDAGMDAEAREKLLSTIQKMQGEGTAFLIITHQPQSFAKLQPLLKKVL
ncbi:MAG: ATP-binding cassette domain-containing protein [Patescibacteria group bacterium]|jgi:Fe-S cluster assembly ATP-binding protein